MILKAFNWFKLQDYMDGKVSRDEAFLKEYVSSQLNEAQQSLQSGQPYLAVQIYEKTLKDLGGEVDLDSISMEVIDLKRSRGFKKARKEFSSVADLEKEWRDKLISRIRDELSREKIPKDFVWWQKELGKLDEEYASSDIQVYQSMGKRLQSMIFAVCIENLQAAVAQTNKFEVDYYSALMQANWSENAFVYIRIAMAYASMGSDQKALDNLEIAISKGWENKNWLQNAKAFSHLQNNSRFLELIAKMP